MRSTRIIVSLIAALGSATAAAGQAPTGMTLTSTAFADGGQIPVKFTQAAPGAAPGEGTSPQLSWANPPQGTQSYVLHMHDLTVARNRTTETQLHWIVWNIAPTTTSLPEGLARAVQLPDGAYQVSSTGPVYRGPGAPATGPLHHYVFELYALDTALPVTPVEDAFATRKAVMDAMQGHVLGKAVYLGFFKRPAQ